MTSHAAVVGRQMGKPSVVGCGALDIDAKARTLKVGGKTLQGRRPDLDRRLDRRGDPGGGADERLRGDPGGRGAAQARAVADLPEVREAPRLGRRGAAARDPRERRHPARRQGGVRLRRRGHRPVPHRAHVLRRGAAAARRADDHVRPRAASAGSTSRRARRSGSRRRRAARRPRSAKELAEVEKEYGAPHQGLHGGARRSSCRCSAPTSRACSRRWTATRSRSARSTRRSTSSCRSARS